MKIEKVKINNFKSLKDIDITLSNITLLTGINSCGKSSFIQAILLLKQNEKAIKDSNTILSLKDLMTENGMSDKINSVLNKGIDTIILDDEYVQLGNYKDTLYEEVSQEDIIISYVSLSNDVYSAIAYDSTLNLKVKQNKFIADNNFNIFKESFQYICTDRIAPQITYSLNEVKIKNNLIGLKGEYTAHYLATNKNKNIFIDALKHPESATKQFLENTSLWLNEISQGIDIASTINPSQKNVSLTYSYIYKDGRTNEYNPLNVGFGITYVLPIIVAILKAKEGDLVIIENPESHLHPAGQSKIAELCAIASANGVQIIIETHSDHFINGIRIATKKGILAPEQSIVYYFRKDKDELETKIDEIKIDKNGGIDKYPKGFFDQMDEDLDKLITW